MKIIFFPIFIILFHYHLHAQELFPNTEPASNVPKGVLGVKAFGEMHQEVSLWRNIGALRLMYGLTPKLTVMVTVSTSNHHGDSLPYNLATHTHIGNQTIYYTQNIQRGLVYPYLFNGVDCYAKYRFFTADGQHTHLRMAVYGEWSNVNVAHDETEPTLLDDTKGYAGGLIITHLKNRFATSLTSGVIIPGIYKETENLSHWTGVNELTTTKIQYGRALQYNLSFGYLLYPKKYENYNQNNWNIYLEFIGKSSETAKIWQNGEQLEVRTPLLTANTYVEVRPGIQKIINSNLRIDFSMGFNLINRSYVNFYPLYMVAVQKYFYPKKKQKKY
jgi:hypothetical protein